MAIEEKEVRHVAKLAKLAFADNEIHAGEESRFGLCGDTTNNA